MKCSICEKNLSEGEKIYRTRKIVDQCIVAKIEDSLDWLTIGNIILEKDWTTCAYCFENPKG